MVSALLFRIANHQDGVTAVMESLALAFIFARSNYNNNRMMNMVSHSGILRRLFCKLWLFFVLATAASCFQSLGCRSHSTNVILQRRITLSFISLLSQRWLARSPWFLPFAAHRGETETCCNATSSAPVWKPTWWFGTLHSVALWDEWAWTWFEMINRCLSAPPMIEGSLGLVPQPPPVPATDGGNWQRWTATVGHQPCAPA